MRIYAFSHFSPFTCLPYLIKIPAFAPMSLFIFLFIQSSLSYSSSHLLHSHYPLFWNGQMSTNTPNSTKLHYFPATVWFPLITLIFRCFLIISDDRKILCHLFFKGALESCKSLSPHSHFSLLVSPILIQPTLPSLSPPSCSASPPFLPPSMSWVSWLISQ